MALHGVLQDRMLALGIGADRLARFDEEPLEEFDLGAHRDVLPARIALALQAMTAEAGGAGAARPATDGDQLPLCHRRRLVNCA
jgi:hypothetical protein